MKNFKQWAENVNSRSLAESQKRDFQKLYKSLKEFSDHSDWFIEISWSEPDDKMNWIKADGYGPLNERFFRWLDQHWDYWQDKAAVGIITNERFHRKNL